MRLRGIKLDRVPYEQRPQRHANRAKQQSERKENPKRLRKPNRRRFPRIDCGSGASVSNSYFSRQKWTVQPPPIWRSTRD